MSILSRIADRLRGHPRPTGPDRPRRERRLEARQRHNATGEPAWTAADRRPGGSSHREVEDVTPGTPGQFGSHRVIDE